MGTFEAAREAALDGLFEAAVAGCGADQKGCLATVRGNRHWKLGVQYLTVDRTEKEWVELRDALGGIKADEAEGEEPDAGCVSLVAQCEAHADVASAKSKVDSAWAAVQTAWNTAVSD